MGRPVTELLPFRGRQGSREPQVVMVPVAKMETEELLVCRCVFWGSFLQACDGAVCPVLGLESREGSGSRPKVVGRH